MTVRTGLHARWVGLLIVVLLLAGASGAAAHWTARTTVDGAAAAATVGLALRLPADASVDSLSVRPR